MDFENLSKQYVGARAEQYDEVRTSGRKWQREERVLGELLDMVPAGARTLDVPVGTGRLFPYYAARNFSGTGVDVSPDMLAEAKRKAADKGLDVTLQQGDIRALPFEDGTFDLVMCIRFLNWVDLAGFRAAVTELVRVSRERLLIGVRHVTPLADFRPTPMDVIRIGRRLLRHDQARATQSGLVYHKKSEVRSVFADMKLQIQAAKTVEKRSDGTDYVIYLLRKFES